MKASFIPRWLFLFLLSVPLYSQAQQPALLQLSGKALGAQQEALPYAAVTLLDTAGQKIQETQTDTTGRFSMAIAPGHYGIRIECMICEPYTRKDLQLQQDTDLGNILIKDNARQLASVEIVEEKPELELYGDKKIYNAGKDIMAKGGSANDLLNNVPSVNVSTNGVVSLRGNENVRVLINGKPSIIANNNGLAQIQAASIEKVEVITNPSARYEAQGGAGIINIVLKKNTLGGLNASLQGGIGDPANYNGNLNLSYKTEKYNLFTNLGYRYRKTYGSEDRYQLNKDTDGASQSVLRQQNTISRSRKGYSIYAGGDYYFNARNTLTGSFYHNLETGRDSTSYFYNYYNSSEAADSNIARFEHYREPQNYNELELNYVKTFAKEGRKWTTNIEYDFWHDDEHQQIGQQKTFPNPGDGFRLVTRDIESSNDIYIQSDYVSPVAGNGRLELGVKANIRAIRSEYESSVNDVPLPGYNNKLYYDENIYGAYVQFGQKQKKFNYLLGLRAELSDIGISDRAGTYKGDKHYINFFPTANLVYTIGKKTDLRLSYSRRINRPQFWQLNAFAGLSDTRNLTIGNPDLNPMYTHATEFTVLLKADKFTLNPSIYYQHTTDYFQFIYYQTPDGYIVRTPVNLDREQRYGLELTGTYNPLPWWRFSVNFNYFGYRQNGNYAGISYSARNHTWNGRINTRMKLPRNFNAECSFQYQAQNEDVQATNKAMYWANMGFSKDILKDKMSIILSINNLFDSQVRKQVIHTDTYDIESSSRWVGRQVNASFIYRFNRSKEEQDRLPD